MSDNQQRQIITIEDVRISYFYGFRPYQGKDSNGKTTENFTCHAIIEPNSQNLQKVKAAQRAAALAGWGPGGEAVLQQLAAQDRLCLHSGDVTKAGEEAYAGKFYVSANNKSKPRIVATRGGANVDVDSNDPAAPYSGCFANVMVEIYAQGANGKPSQWGKRINASLMGVQFVRHAPRLGGSRIATPDEFGIVATEADGAVPMTAPSAPVAASGSDLV